MTVGIDLISSERIAKQLGVNTGGMNYVKSITKQLLYKASLTNVRVVFFSLKEKCECDKDILLNQDIGLITIRANSLSECDLSNVDVLYMPQVNGTSLREVPKIRARYKKLRICATIHDKQHNVKKYDWMDRYYYSGFERTGIPGFFAFYIKKIVFNIVYRRSIKCIDKVFTVSNYSMQCLQNRHLRNIAYYIPGIIENKSRTKSNLPLELKYEYVLFVSGGRPEKNLLRTMIAFLSYKKQKGNELKLVVTGVSDDTKANLIKYLDGKKYWDSSSVVFYDYVCENELTSLYENCKFVVFTSKGEGYGLPVTEAFAHGKTLIASNQSSIPEVGGAAVEYVDPYSINSIINGFEALGDHELLKRYESYIGERVEIIKLQAKQDMSILVDEILMWKNL